MAGAILLPKILNIPNYNTSNNNLELTSQLRTNTHPYFESIENFEILFINI